MPPIHAYQGTCRCPGANSLPDVASVTAPSASEPTRNETNAAMTGEPDALPRMALVGAWIASRTPATRASSSERLAAFIAPPFRRSVGGVEQMPVLARLRAEILRRRLHARSQVSGGVPRPARIVKHAPGERDHVGVAGADDGFGLLEVRDEADGDHGHRDRLLDGAGERNLVARAA